MHIQEIFIAHVLPFFVACFQLLYVKYSSFFPIVFLRCHKFWIGSFSAFPPLLCLIFRNLSDVLWEAISTHQVLSLYQGLGTKNLQAFIAQFIYFYGYSYLKRLYLKKSGIKSVGTKTNLVLAAAAGACTAIVTQVSDGESSFG